MPDFLCGLPVFHALITFLPVLALPVSLGSFGLFVPEPTTYLNLSSFVQLTTDPFLTPIFYQTSEYYALMTASNNHINSFTTNFLSNCQNKEQETKFGQLPVIDLSLSQLSQNIPSKTGTK
jgi:hypothetical protein